MFDEGLEKFVSSVGVDGKCKFTENAYYLTISSCVLFLLWASRVTLAKNFFSYYILKWNCILLNPASNYRPYAEISTSVP